MNTVDGALQEFDRNQAFKKTLEHLIDVFYLSAKAFRGSVRQELQCKIFEFYFRDSCVKLDEEYEAKLNEIFPDLSRSLPS